MVNGKTEASMDSRVEAIARLNDQLREQGIGGTIMVTSNVKRITGFNAQVLAAELAAYEGFDPGNDPYGERDFGTLTVWGHDLLWKIDYYDRELRYGSEDPSNPDITGRVLTIMLASDC